MGKRQRRRQRSDAASASEASGSRYRYKVIETPELPEQDRAAAVSRLAGLGAERLRLVGELARVDEDLRPRVRFALSVGVPYRRIEELTGYSRSALSRWSRDL